MAVVLAIAAVLALGGRVVRGSWVRWGFAIFAVASLPKLLDLRFAAATLGHGSLLDVVVLALLAWGIAGAGEVLLRVVREHPPSTRTARGP